MPRRSLLILTLLLALLLAPPLWLAATLREERALALRPPWAAGAAYLLAAQPCSADRPGRIVLRRVPSYYVIARGDELLSLPLTPRCP